MLVLILFFAIGASGDDAPATQSGTDYVIFSGACKRSAAERGTEWQLRDGDEDHFQGVRMINRRISLLIVVLSLMAKTSFSQAQNEYAAPESPRIRYNFNLDWKFLREDVPGAEAVSFDDSKWQTISTPHSFNDVDSFRKIIGHAAGDKGTYKGLAWYRKHFKLPANAAGGRVFIEFEGMRQAGDIFLNGKEIGLYENGVTAYGLDITPSVRFDGENVLAVKIDNRTTYVERATQTPFEWNFNSNNSNPDYGGINRHVWLHITGKIHQTLPLYYGLETTGVYIQGGNFDIAGKKADITAESQVENSSQDRATVALSVVVVNRDGKVAARFPGDSAAVAAGGKKILKATGPLQNGRFWSIEDPNLYDVYTILTVDGNVVDQVKTITGFRKVEFKGGAGVGGVYINNQYVYLKGFSNRSSDEWAGLGQAYPDWMHDFSAQLLRDCNGNYERWMHVSPQRVDVESYDRYGIVEVCPAGDGEHDVQGRQWDQRAEVMRDSIIYFRNNPSILFWEAGNSGITGPQMQQMVALRKEFDPSGGRVMGCRSLRDPEAAAAAEYFGVMLGGPYSAGDRDHAPIVETEDFRDEGARRFWDDFSPPYFGFKKGPADTYGNTSETFALAQAKRYWSYWSNRISNTDPDHAKWSAYASIYFTDSDADGRQDTSEVCRVSGKVDAVRLPKEIYFAERVMQNTQPDIHIIGHWSYPEGTVKTMYVIANNVDSVEFFVNGITQGKNDKPENGYVYAFPNIKFAAGSVNAVGYKNGQAVTSHELKTAGAPAAIKLTVHTSSDGLAADGEDVAFIDFEVVDANGQRCPTDDARVDFSLDGPAIWRGGYNSGKLDSTNNLFLNTECGINRVAVRSILNPGTITITAKRVGLQSATVTIDAKAVKIQDGLTAWTEPHLRGLGK